MRSSYRYLGFSGLERRMLSYDLTALYSFMSRGKGGLSFSAWDPVTECVEVVESRIMGGLDGTLGSISLPKE